MKRRIFGVLIFVAIALVLLFRVSQVYRSALFNSHYSKDSSSSDALLLEAASLGNDALYESVTDSLDPFDEDGKILRINILDTLREIQETSKSTNLRLKPSYITFRIAPCDRFSISEVKSVLSDQIFSFDPEEIPTNRVHILSLDPDRSFPAVPCLEGYELEPKERAKEMFDIPMATFDVVYTSGGGIEPHIKECPIDWEWRSLFINRIDKVRLVIEEYINDFGSEENEKKPMIFPWTVVIPSQLFDLKFSPLSLEGLHFQTRIPSNVVIVIGQYNPEDPSHCSQMATFLTLLKQNYGFDHNFEVIASRNQSSVGMARVAGIRHAGTPYFSSFDVDDLMHPLYLEMREETMKRYPEADMFLPGVWSSSSWMCTMQTYFLFLQEYLKTTTPLKSISLVRKQWYNLLAKVFDKWKIPEQTTKEWYIGNTDVEPWVDPNHKPYLTFYIGECANGWHSGKKTIINTVPYQMIQMPGEDSKYNIRAYLAGFGVKCTRGMEGFYAFRVLKEFCKEDPKLELENGKDIEKAFKMTSASHLNDIGDEQEKQKLLKKYFEKLKNKKPRLL